MVKPQVVGGVVARAALLACPAPVKRAPNKETYADRSHAAIGVLQKWYITAEGLWDTTGWWNSGNVLTTLSDFAQLDGTRADQLDIKAVVENTFNAAQKNTQVAHKTITASGLVESHYEPLSKLRRRGGRASLETRGFAGFINDFYDDEGWWALAWIRAFDVYGTRKYLDMAETIFEDMRRGTDNVCGGGIWWNKEKKYKNAIANELYLTVAASLANRDVRAKTKANYRDIATKQWTWLKGSGMLNKDNLFNDGLTINADGSCTNNKAETWTYNQGVILGGLVELNKLSGNTSASAGLLDTASAVASAAISRLSKNGILVEPCEPSSCGGDGPQFKGIFVRNLRSLALALPAKTEFRDFIFANADSIWDNSRNQTSNELGLVWAGPHDKGRAPGADTQSSALDVLVAAIAVA